MKPELYWHEEFSKCSTPAEDDAVVRAIQADALRHVAKEVNTMGLAANHPAVRNHCGMLAEALLVDATKLEAK